MKQNMSEESREKVVERMALGNKVLALKRDGKKIVFTNGCFDLIHVGHVRYLSVAKAQGDVLVVAINSDSSISGIKGPKRPIVPFLERAEVLAALTCVDFVTWFDEPDPKMTIEILIPDVLVKGADWAIEAIVGRDIVESHGGRVVRVPLAQGASTTRIIETILKKYGKGDA